MTQLPNSPQAPVMPQANLAQQVMQQNQQLQEQLQQQGQHGLPLVNQYMQQPVQVQPQNTQLSTDVIGHIPAFLQTAGDAPTGVAEIKQYILPSFLMIRQGLVDNEQVRQRFVEGDVYLSPELQGIYMQSTGRVPVAFTPILSYTEFTIQNPRGSNLPWIRERTLDPNSDIAKRARNAAWRRVPCPEMPSKECVYVEHINFLVMLHIHNGPTLPVIMGFSKAEFITGRKFVNLLLQRTGPQGTLPVYSGIYQFTTGTRTNNEGTWWGFDIVNHPTQPYVTQEQFDGFKNMHLDLSQKVAKGEVQADYETAASVAPAGPAPMQHRQAQQPQQPQQAYYGPPNMQGNGNGGIDPNAAFQQAAHGNF